MHFQLTSLELYILIGWLLFLFIVVIWWHSNTRLPKQFLLIDATHELSPGDLIFTKGTKPSLKYAWWQHVAIAFRDTDGEMKVADVSSFNRKQIAFFTWRELVKAAKPRTLIAIRRLKVPMTASKSDALTAFIYKNREIVFDTEFMITWLSAQLPKMRQLRKVKTLFCSAFVSQCLIHLNILPACTDPHSVSVSRLTSTKWIGHDADPYSRERLVIKHVPCPSAGHHTK